MDLSDLADESRLAFCESVHRQVLADVKLYGHYCSVGTNVKQYVDHLKTK